MDGEYIKTKTVAVDSADTPIDYKAEVLKVYPSAMTVNPTTGGEYSEGYWKRWYEELQREKNHEQKEKAARKRAYTLELVKAIAGSGQKLEYASGEEAGTQEEMIVRYANNIVIECEKQGLLV